MTFQLSDRAKELIPKARIVSFAGFADVWGAHAIACLQAADDEGRYLSDEDLTLLEQEAASHVSSANLTVTRYLRDNAKDIVTSARQQVLAQYPGITEPGGELYPAIRAEACWRDFWHFLRCITYGIACNGATFTSAEGLHYMNLLYQEMKVPLMAMVTGLECLKSESLQRLSEQDEVIVDSFDHLIGQMRAFK